MVYSNFFTSYIDASHSIGDDCNLSAYSSSRWIKRLEEFNKIVLSHSNLSYKNCLPRSSSLPLFISANSNIARILDIGGGGGWLGLHIKKLYSHITAYDIVEIDFVKNYFADYLKSYSINYLEDADLTNYDVLYTNSCIQYMSSIDYLLKCTKISSPQYLILDDLYLSQKDQFYCHQKYYDKVMIMSFISFEQLRQSLLRLGYSLWFSNTYSDPILGKDDKLPFDNTVLESWRPKERYTLVFKSAFNS